MHKTRRELIIGAPFAFAAGISPMLAPAAPAETWSARLIEAYNDLGQRLFKQFANTPRNVVFSPYSIGAAIAMALAGARSMTEAEMAQVVGLGLSLDEVNTANAAVLASLNKMSSAFLQLQLANALIVTDKQEAISQDYVEALRKNYAAEVFRDGTLATINAWVKQKTGGKIDSILKELDPTTAMVLVDAIYFKASWQRPFDKFATEDATFHFVNGTTAKVPMMSQQHEFALAEMQDYSAIRLPYDGSRVSMVVILPNAGITSVMQRLNGEELQHLLASLRTSERPVALSLPRFKTSLRVDLVEPLKELGMRRAFDRQTADFSGITGKPPSQAALRIDQIVHDAVIDVTEEGTEAAAVTEESFATSAIEAAHWQPFRVDRPFLYAVVDDETGAILFEGLIIDPRQGS